MMLHCGWSWINDHSNLSIAHALTLQATLAVKVATDIGHALPFMVSVDLKSEFRAQIQSLNNGPPYIFFRYQ
jgi:hypothetical protein